MLGAWQTRRAPWRLLSRAHPFSEFSLVRTVGNLYATPPVIRRHCHCHRQAICCTAVHPPSICSCICICIYLGIGWTNLVTVPDTQSGSWMGHAYWSKLKGTRSGRPPIGSVYYFACACDLQQYEAWARRCGIRGCRQNLPHQFCWQPWRCRACASQYDY